MQRNHTSPLTWPSDTMWYGFVFSYLEDEWFIWVTFVSSKLCGSFFSDPWHHQGISTKRGYDSVAHTPKDHFVGKSQQISCFWNTQITTSSTNNHVTFKVSSVIFLPHSDALFQLQQLVVGMCTCATACSCWGVWKKVPTEYMIALRYWELYYQLRLIVSEKNNQF